MTYNALTDQFQFDWKIAKGTKLGDVNITATAKNADDSTNATKTTR